MDKGREQAYEGTSLLCKVQSSTLAPGKQHSFTGEHLQTDKESAASFSVLLLSLVVTIHTVLMRIGDVLLHAGIATLLSDLIYSLFVFPELFCEGGGGQGMLGREEIPTLSQGTT